MASPMQNEEKNQAMLEAQAAVFRHLIDHLDKNKQAQNIELMLLADFCRNCLSKWYLAESTLRGLDINDEEAREFVYKMPYSEWKENHQLPATAEQMDAFKAKQERKK